ncbi:hypothetical protein [Kocuria flava]|uniref:hypothetical protein n=1 Tax=Kocuria flava TaxID=446860 RepID=UPI002F92C535
MDHKLSVLIQIDLDGAYVRLAVTGCLTEANQHVLYPLIRRARALIPPVTVHVDLTAAAHLEPAAVDLLRWGIDHDEPLDGAGPVQLLLPQGRPPVHPSHAPHRPQVSGRGGRAHSTSLI